MKIHSICLVKNERDIIAETLDAAATWSDFIYVYDNGSTDGTWEWVLDLSRRLPQVIPFASEARPFHDDLRREPFHHYRDRSSPGDWWCRLDADEIYIDSPRDFLAGVPERFDVVWAAMFQYYLTERDVARFAMNPELYADDVSVDQKCKYYINNWSVIKFFKYGTHLRWDSGGQPYPLTRSYPHRIRMKHYQYRSPRQIELRLATRRGPMSRGRFKHESRDNWTEWILTGADRYRGAGGKFPESWTDRVVDSSRLIHDTGAHYVIAEATLPPITDPNPFLLRKVAARINEALSVAMQRMRKADRPRSWGGRAEQMRSAKTSVPVVSVVIPTYNRAHLLPRALDSALAQTHQDLEIIVVDDGSTDATAGVVEGYGDPRMRLIRLASRSGVSRARNAGIVAARGEWVAFLDSDDEWRPAKLELQLARVAGEDRGADIVYCVRLIEDDVTGRTWPHRGPLHEGQVFETMLGGGWTPPTSLVMVRRAALAAVGGFDETLPSFEDYDLWLRLARAGYRFAAVDAVLVVKHRGHGPQITRDHRARALGARRLDEKWGAVIRERLGAVAHRAWLDDRLTALPQTQRMQVRSAVANGDRALAWRRCRAVWRVSWTLRLRYAPRAVAITLLGCRAYGAIVGLRRILPIGRRPSR